MGYTKIITNLIEFAVATILNFLLIMPNILTIRQKRREKENAKKRSLYSVME